MPYAGFRRKKKTELLINMTCDQPAGAASTGRLRPGAAMRCDGSRDRTMFPALHIYECPVLSSSSRIYFLSMALALALAGGGRINSPSDQELYGSIRPRARLFWCGPSRGQNHVAPHGAESRILLSKMPMVLLLLRQLPASLRLLELCK